MSRSVGLLIVALLASACAAGAALPEPERDSDIAPPTTAGFAAQQVPAPLTAADLGEIRVDSQPAEPRHVSDQQFSFPTRLAVTQRWVPFARVGDIVLHHPSDVVETVGFHESSHDGAQQMTPTDEAVAPFTMQSRDRGNGSRTAVDIAVEPGRTIRSPVTGTVLRAGSYVLYCQYSDDFAVIAPDARPGWELKVLHIDNVRVRAGDRVEAGVTEIADGPTPLPFRSQVDDVTAGPSWPHVHIELVDPTVRDRPGPGC